MSFGQGAAREDSRAARRPRDGDRCPCGSGARFGDCCGPVLDGEPAGTAEALMRSRYTAFVTGDARHLLETWHPGTRPGAVDPEPGLRWQGLEIIDVLDGRPDDKKGIVEFLAHWRAGADRGTLHERSRFLRQSGRWFYVDGEIRG